ncbi:hypothetical protein MPSEU_000624500 [Mayamaea pseudoterrestris]|nr:hypothetical protein MPSEU_000624500 [Mayamaea pseudoterrestris]
MVSRFIQSLFLLLLALFAGSAVVSAAEPAQGQCQTFGLTCSTTSDCCFGPCRQGTCRRCVKRNKACESDDDCCGRKICGASNVCVRNTQKSDPDAAIADNETLPTSWPEALGKTGEEAKTMILTTDSTLNVEIIPFDVFVTADWFKDRVRVRVDDKGIVTEVPEIG